MANPWYATREEVKGAADIAETAHLNTRIDRALEAASRAVEKLCHRVFYPTLATRYFDWPDSQQGTSWRLWLNEHEVISVTTLSSGGTTIASSDYFLYPQSGPPYSRIEIDLSSSAAFGGGDTSQRDIAVTGLFGYTNDEESAGTLAAAVSSTSATTVDVSDSSAIGVGQLIRVESERMIVTGNSSLTTAQTLQDPMTADTADTVCQVTTGTSYNVGEVILLDAERMLIEDIAGNNLIVQRAFDGTVLAAHTGSTIYARRRLTVQRGALGTTAATHDSGTTINRHMAPGPVRRLTIAEAQTTLAQEDARWARAIGAGESAREAWARSLKDARDEVYENYGRKARIRAVTG